ncbi:MAG: hypothetical protein QGG36_18725 [Pirellulaceae bacterium]|jgi:hypothetical protein|nr:hypothetical protein [Pirellulaceae bacterium]
MAVWQVNADNATVVENGFCWAVELKHPSHGIRLSGNGQEQAGILRLQLPGAVGEERILDSYVRGSDLLIQYDQADDRDVLPHIYWRHWPAPGGHGVQMIVSMQTDRLASHPRSVVTTALDGPVRAYSARTDTWRGCDEWGPSDRAETFLSEHSAGSLGVMVHESDYGSCQVSDDRVQYELFSDSLEKGVIRRCRLAAVWFPGDLSTARAADAYDAFANADLPLTT